MDVFLLRSEELSKEKYFAILNVLNQYKGPIGFISTESEIVFEEKLTRTWKNEKEFGRQMDTAVLSSPSRGYFAEPISFPYEENFQPWSSLFKKCQDFRKKQRVFRDLNVSEEDLVILLTEQGNEFNWFGSLDNSKNFFVQTSGWAHFLGLDIDERFPIAFTITNWILRHMIFENREAVLDAMHKESIGCCNDFCEEKKDIILKMRTADLCASCMKKLEQKAISPMILNQLFSIIDGIRSSMTFRNRMAITQKPSKLEIRDYTMRLFLTELGDLELNFNPKERAIYMFFLKHPEGVRLSELQDFEDEILSYYVRFTGIDSHEAIQESVKRLLDPLDNNMNEVISRIKSKLKKAVGDKLLHHYIIDGPRGEKKRISLDREYVFFMF